MTRIVRSLCVASAVAFVCIAALSVAGAQEPDPVAAPAASEETTTPTQQPEETAMAKEQVFAVFETTQGDFACLLYTDKMPITTQNFIDLAEGKKDFMDPATGQMVKRPFYDGRKIFRVVRGFMFQTGSANDTGAYESGFTIPDEFDASLRYDKPGLLAMANRGPNTGSTQFFLTFSGPGCGHLQGKHPIFGEVIEGMDSVRKIENLEVKMDPWGRERSAPVDPPAIKKVTIKRQAAK